MVGCRFDRRLWSKRYLVAVDTARLECLGVVSAAVDVAVAVLVEVDEVDQQLDAHDADETRRVPADVISGPTREHRQLALPHWLTAL